MSAHIRSEIDDEPLIVEDTGRTAAGARGSAHTSFPSAPAISSPAGQEVDLTRKMPTQDKRGGCFLDKTSGDGTSGGWLGGIAGFPTSISFSPDGAAPDEANGLGTWRPFSSTASEKSHLNGTSEGQDTSNDPSAEQLPTGDRPKPARTGLDWDDAGDMLRLLSALGTQRSDGVGLAERFNSRETDGRLYQSLYAPRTRQGDTREPVRVPAAEKESSSHVMSGQPVLAMRSAVDVSTDPELQSLLHTVLGRIGTDLHESLRTSRLDQDTPRTAFADEASLIASSRTTRNVDLCEGIDNSRPSAAPSGSGPSTHLKRQAPAQSSVQVPPAKRPTRPATPTSGVGLGASSETSLRASDAWLEDFFEVIPADAFVSGSLNTDRAPRVPDGAGNLVADAHNRPHASSGPMTEQLPPPQLPSKARASQAKVPAVDRREGDTR